MARQKSSGILSVAFNQDNGCFTCCLNTGVRVYNTEPLVEHEKHGTDVVDEIHMCEMRYRTNWLFCVKTKEPNDLYIFDCTEGDYSSHISLDDPILAVRARRDKIAVVHATQVIVIAVPSMMFVAKLLIPEMPRPLCAFTYDQTAPQILVAPTHRRGSLQLIDVSKATSIQETTTPIVFNCHQHNITCIALSYNGTRLATASTQGTLIRLWDTGTRALLQEFRRGADVADIHSISFNMSTTMLCCMSDKGTLHVWSTKGGHSVAPPAAAGEGPSAVLPGVPPLAVHASVRAGTRGHCGFVSDNGICIVCEDGTYHKFIIASSTLKRTEFDYFLEIGDDDDFCT